MFWCLLPIFVIMSFPLWMFFFSPLVYTFINRKSELLNSQKTIIISALNVAHVTTITSVAYVYTDFPICVFCGRSEIGFGLPFPWIGFASLDGFLRPLFLVADICFWFAIAWFTIWMLQKKYQWINIKIVGFIIAVIPVIFSIIQRVT